MLRLPVHPVIDWLDMTLEPLSQGSRGQLLKLKIERLGYRSFLSQIVQIGLVLLELFYLSIKLFEVRLMLFFSS